MIFIALCDVGLAEADNLSAGCHACGSEHEAQGRGRQLALRRIDASVAT